MKIIANLKIILLRNVALLISLKICYEIGNHDYMVVPFELTNLNQNKEI